ncbi:MAG: hypothetical protein XD76_0573 [candidate division TA06 bacterium 32_111]|nr:MAG: hypothetical protein XD76_0573 [candidate division TA06 bacterium 32_111]
METLFALIKNAGKSRIVLIAPFVVWKPIDIQWSTEKMSGNPRLNRPICGMEMPTHVLLTIQLCLLVLIAPFVVWKLWPPRISQTDAMICLNRTICGMETSSMLPLIINFTKCLNRTICGMDKFFN